MKVAFRIDFAGTEGESRWSASGLDEVTYMIATNPGEPMHPLENIASGGELSRVMLALKATVEAGTTSEQEEGLSAHDGF